MFLEKMFEFKSALHKAKYTALLCHLFTKQIFDSHYNKAILFHILPQIYI